MEYIYDFYVHSQLHVLRIFDSWFSGIIRVVVDKMEVYEKNHSEDSKHSFFYEYEGSNFRISISKPTTKFEVRITETGPDVA